jgi:hypothetical protein
MKLLSKTITPRQELVICGICLMVILCAAVIFGAKNMEPEALAYIPAYLRDIPLLMRVFDISNNDVNIFRARELSYLLGIFDANLLLTAYKFGVVRFFSFIHLVAIFLIGMVHLRFTQIYFPSSNFVVRVMPILLFATAPAAFAGCGFFRTSKVLVALGVIVLCWELYGIFRRNTNQKLSTTKAIWLTSFATVVTLCDEQGVFLILALVAITAIGLYFRRSSARFQAIFCFSLALAFHAFYRFYLGLWLITRYYGAPPDPSIQRTPSLGDLFSFRDKFGDASVFLFDTLKFTVGNSWLIAVLVCLLFALKYRKRQSSAESVAIFWAVVAATWGMCALMIGRHPGIMGIDVRRIYYAIPLATLMLFGLSLLLISFAQIDVRVEKLLSWILCFCFLANLVAIPSHQAVLDSHGFRPYALQSQELTNCLKAEGEYRIEKFIEESDKAFLELDDKAQIYCDLFKKLAQTR